MPHDQVSKTYSWKLEADLTDVYRRSIIHVAEQSIAEFDQTGEARHHREDLAWMLQLFTGAYDEIVATYIEPRRATDPNAANHLAFLLGSLMVVACDIGGRAVTDNPAIETAKEVLSSRQASRARAAKQLKFLPEADERRRAIIEIAGGEDKLKRGPKFAGTIRFRLESNPKFTKMLARGRGFST
jgi:hypothetical protein